MLHTKQYQKGSMWMMMIGEILWTLRGGKVGEVQQNIL